MATSNAPEQPGVYRLIKNGTVIYVGYAQNLKQRITDWMNSPNNPCVKRLGWDNCIYQPTVTIAQAKVLELSWYRMFNPQCNLVTPPG